MKNKIIFFILIAFAITSSILVLILFNYNTELEKQIVQKNKIINNTTKTDSLLINKTKDYAKKIEKYISEPIFTKNGVKITSSDLIKITNDAINENQTLKDSISYYKQKAKVVAEVYPSEFNNIINKYKDSLFVTKWQIELAKKDYGINYIINKKDDNTYTSLRKISMIDSAIVLFPYYKHRLSSEDGKFVIETDKEFRKLKKQREMKK